MDKLELFVEFAQVEREVRDLDAELKAAKTQRAGLAEQILTAVFEGGLGVQNVTVNGFTVYLTHQLWARCPREHKQALCDALKAEGLGDMVSETFSSSTLSAWVREIAKEGGADDLERIKELIPEAVREHVELSDKYDVRARSAD